ncbi:hypothetical protein [Nocardioides caldifontis]|uniref:hypothetical protein n=1 Tax=Nocardioides caldifontis TaxID=2588938 RepID=UPI0011DF0D84|nr:hypothetical protein [Nocardioides caldifontis]
MSNPFSGLVLLGAGLVSSPAIYAAVVDGTLALETALVRFLVAWAVVWVGFSVLGSIGDTSGSAQPEVPRSLPAVDGPVPVRPAELRDDPPTAVG